MHKKMKTRDEQTSQSFLKQVASPVSFCLSTARPSTNHRPSIKAMTQCLHHRAYSRLFAAIRA
jgi:hypothetical protein